MRVFSLSSIFRGSVLILTLFSLSACHPWFRMGPGAPPDQVPVIVSPDGTPYIPGTPTWVPLIDQCMADGGSRNACIENLPPDEKANLEAWEADRAVARRRLLEERLRQQ